MKAKYKKGLVPLPETHETIRQELIDGLLRGPCSARDLSAIARIPERDVPYHLERIQKSLATSGGRLIILPAECKKCGFVFTKREKLKRPGKCPVCSGESIQEPLFTIDPRNSRLKKQ